MEKDRGFPLSIFAWFGYALPLAESLGKIRAAGFDAVLLWWSDGLDGLSRIDQAALAAGTGSRWKTHMPRMTAVTIYGCPEKRGRVRRPGS